MSGPGPLAELRGVTKTYPGVRALLDVDLELLPGEVHGLAGENGAGKSTLVKVLSGAIAPDRGEIRIDGQRVALRNPRDAIERGIRVVHQELAGAPHLSVTENILLGALPRRLGRVQWGTARRRARELLDALEADVDEQAVLGRLPIGQQQLVEIARALASDLRILVLDEPSAILGRHDLEVLFATVRRLRDRGVACVYISHRLGELFTLADRVTVLKDGRRVGTHAIGELDVDRLVTLMTGRQLRAPEHRVSVAGGTPALAVRDLTRRGAFAGISFTIAAGEIVGLAGLVGSGRSEVARAIAGADRAEGGTVEVDGQRLAQRGPRSAQRAGIGLLPEDRKDQGLLLNRSVRENVGLASLPRRSCAGLIRSRADLAEVRELCQQLDVRSTGPDQLVRDLSGGNQQKVLLARWLAAGSKILLLDEPTRGVDVGGKSEIYALIRRLAEDGVAMLMISSEIEEIVALSDRVLVMREGKLVVELAGDAIDEDRILRAALVRSVGEGSEAA